MTEIALYPAWKNAVRAFLALEAKPGDIITHEWLREQFDIGPDRTVAEARENQLNYLQAFSQFRDALLEDYRIAFASAQGVGYRIIPPAEQTRYAVAHHMSKVHKEMRNMARTMAFVRHDELTDAERRANADALAKAAQLSAMIRTNRIIPRIASNT